MYRQRIEALLERKRELLIARDISGLVDIYAIPIPMYHPNGLKVVATAADMRFAIENIVAGMDEIGVSQVTARVLEVDEALRRGHSSARVEICYLDMAGGLLRRSRLRYFIREDRHRLKIVMLEYLETGFAKVFDRMRMRIS